MKFVLNYSTTELTKGVIIIQNLKIIGGVKMIDPNDIPKAIETLKKRIQAKKDLVKFTEMEIGEMERTIIKMEKK